MDFILSFEIDFTQPYSEDYLQNKMKEAIKFQTSSEVRKTSSNGRHLFVCQTSGEDCFCAQFEPIKDSSMFKLKDGLIPKHKYGCQKKGQASLYIKTMMLLKLRKEYLQDFLEENELIGQSPKKILLVYSRKRHNLPIPFYESYLTDRSYIQKIKKKWANLMDAIRKSKTEQHNIVKMEEPMADQTTTYTHLNDNNTVSVKPIFGLFSKTPLEQDKENWFFQVKFDRVKEKPPEVKPYQEDHSTTCSAFGSLPTYLINSSLEKQSLRDLSDRLT